MDSDSWIRRYHPAPQSRVRLAVLPHAGGSATYYHPFSRLLHPLVEVLAVQYPGRQERRHEEPVTDIGLLADQVTAALLPWTGQPLALFGHSMGATLGFEVARRLERRGTPPVALIASGRRAPHIEVPERVHLLDDEGVLAEVAQLSGTDPHLLEDEEVRAMTLRTLRGDYRAIETYRCDAGATVGCPVLALGGDNDPRVPVDQLRAWRERTTGGFGIEVFDGGHFYLAGHRRAVADQVLGALLPRG